MPGSYTILGALAKGGMGSVYLGRLTGSAGFSRLVAIKRLHPELAVEQDFVAMLIDEARLAAQIRHTNVVDTLDFVASDGAFNLVLEYVEGDSISALTKSARQLQEPLIDQPITLAIIYGVLRGLDAAHDARAEDGSPLGIVHRDVSPQNVLVGIDGVPRIIDFGVAKALGRFSSTKPGEVRGKFAYMAPEQLLGRPVTRQVDVYAAGVVLWELLTGEKLFTADDQRVISAAVLRGDIKPPSSVNPAIPKTLDEIVLRATSRELSDRYMTAREFLNALEDSKCPRASDDEVGVWVRRLSARRLAERAQLLKGENAAPNIDMASVEQLMADLAKSGQQQQPGGLSPPTPTSTRSMPGIEVHTMPLAGGGMAPSPPLSARSPGGFKLQWLGIALASIAFALTVVVGITVQASRRPPLTPIYDPTPVPMPLPLPTEPPTSTTATGVVIAPPPTVEPSSTKPNPAAKSPPPPKRHPTPAHSTSKPAVGPNPKDFP